ncbi:phospholipase D-like domain-containing protein [Chelativorans sp. YIM 93263]|uniref:phospholipase D-like domain-containing protein n=1 Tax=Chelativorans sp. YIM 93263 TaxID=2906648 RepID=UPI0023799F43|nr:phospholipase D-like domain-containing protein [Chelativorans sp. YIM 93263]
MSQLAKILRPGKNCWRIERASRLALIVDAEDYFKAVKEAILHAHHSVYLIGWDFDTRIKFEPEGKTLEGPNKLGPFLQWIDKNRPEVEVFVLKWDLGAVQALGRGTTPLAILNWLTSKRIHFKLDGAHPRASVHHQKIVVVDDVIAFCGGIDMTADRWDTREHRDKDPRRRRPSGRRYGPWHDASIVVDGDVPKALGELARERWRWAGGEELIPPEGCSTIWPQSIQPTFRDIDVGIARTIPQYEGRKEVREIERLYLDAIASAKEVLYCESQYFASRRIAEAMAERLRETNGPEIIIVNPESADGFLESVTMDTARYRLLKLIHKADKHDRFRIYTPVTENGEPIYVHAKITIADDRLLRVGSSNFNNRSMGFDTECDLVVEAAGPPRAAQAIRAAITGVRNDLVAEHLGITVEEMREAMDRGGSLVAAIDALRGSGRTLVPYEPDEPADIEEALAENDLLDPEQPPSWTKRALQKFLLQGFFR